MRLPFTALPIHISVAPMRGKLKVLAAVAVDQHVNGATVSRAGADITISEPFEADNVRAAQLRVLDEQYFTDARRLPPSTVGCPRRDGVLASIVGHLEASESGIRWNRRINFSEEQC